MKHIERVVRALIHSDAYKAVIIDTPTLAYTATARHKIGPRTGKRAEILLTIGRPNYAMRKFVKECIKAKVTLPLRKPLLIPYPVKREKKSKRRSRK